MQALSRVRPLLAFTLCATFVLPNCRPRTDPTQFATVTRPRRALRLFTDSDTVLGASAGSVELYVATLRGVVRYPLSGQGEARRNTVSDGLPDDRVYAVAVSPEGIPFAATANGVARLIGDRWERTNGPQPDVGRVTAMVALARGTLMLGGSHGLAEFRDGAWAYITTQHQITCLALDGEKVLVGTAQSGLMVLERDHLSGEGHTPSTGFPAPMVRSVVPVGDGKLWALTQDVGGARLAYWDGQRWFAYTHARLRNTWLALVPSRDGRGVSLVLQGRWFDLLARQGQDEGSLALVSAAAPTAAQRLTLRASPVPPGTIPGTSAGIPGVAPPSPPAGAPGASGRSGGADMSFTADEATSTAGAGRVRAIDLPPPSTPIEAPTTPPVAENGERIQSPFFSLATANVPMPDDAVGLFVDSGKVYAAREGKGLVRVSGGESVTYALRDLTQWPRGLQCASDGQGRTWFLGPDNVMLGYDGRRWTRKAFRELLSLDEESPQESAALAESVPLALYAQGAVSAAVARVGTDKLVVFRWADGAFQPVATRRIRIARGATLDASFMGVDPQSRFWVGLSVGPSGSARVRGAVLIDGNLPRVTEFHSQARPRRASANATSPDNLASIAFDQAGSAWFSGVEGAVQITATEPRRAATVRVFREPQGVRGDLVNDIVRGPRGYLYVSTPEGFGAWDGRTWDFAVTGARTLFPAVAMAGDNSAVYGVSPRGAWIFDDTGGRRLEDVERGGAGPLRDVMVDPQGRVWFLGDQGLLQFDPSAQSASSATDGSDGTGGTGGTGGETESALTN
ncbi:MAG: hypothetical protein Q8Q09_07550 [Deltaproteobacteria bacterium]|nr:hypothetical protein [Deltaproteobacteria bacterium]